MIKSISIASEADPVEVSICIPTYNGGKYLAETLRSVEDQDFRGTVEVIISDGGSTDDTRAIAEAAARNSRHSWKHVRNSQRGIGRNWNNCVGLARGKYIKLLMQDDVLYPGHLSTLVAACEQHPTVGLAFARRDVLTHENTTDNWRPMYDNLHRGWSKMIQEGLFVGRKLLHDPNFLSNPRNKIGEPSSVLLRRAAVQATGEFNVGLPQSLDYEYWYRMMLRYDVYFVDQALSMFRRHPQQASAVNHAATFKKDGQEVLKLYQSYLWHLWPALSPRVTYKIFKEVYLNYSPRLRQRLGLTRRK